MKSELRSLNSFKNYVIPETKDDHEFSDKTRSFYCFLDSHESGFIAGSESTGIPCEVAFGTGF